MTVVHMIISDPLHPEDVMVKRHKWIDPRILKRDAFY